MRKTKSIAVIVTLVLVFAGSACKKDKDEINIPLIDYLTIEELYQYTGGGEEGWRDSLYMEYNSNDQLIKLTGDYDVLEFEYDAEGRVVRMDVDYVGINKRPSASYILFTWDGNTVSAREYYGPDEPSSRKYVYTMNTDDQVIKIEEWYEDITKSVESWIMTEYLDFTWTNNNVTKMEYYSRGRKSNPAGEFGFASPFTMKSLADTDIDLSDIDDLKAVEDFVLSFKLEATYDNKINPFVMYPGLGLYQASEMAHIFLSKNNVVSYSETYYYYEPEMEAYTVTNEYNQQNVPVRIEHSKSASEGKASDYSYSSTWEITYL
jgi:hypothetical protein